MARTNRRVSARLTRAVCGAGALLATATSVSTAQPGRSPDSALALVGSVQTGEGVGVSGATVTLHRQGAGPLVQSTVTDTSGGFRFGAVAPGPVWLSVRRIGFQADTVPVEMPLPRGAFVAVALAPVTPVLTPVVVRANRVDTGPFAGFNHRRRAGFGYFVTRAEIERRRPTRTTDLFRQLPGVTFRPGDGGMTLVRFRGNNCDPFVWVDGTPLGPVFFDFNAIAAASLEGLEIYEGLATTPPEFRATMGRGSCGVIVVWTRQGEVRARAKRRGARALSSADLAGLVDSARLYTAAQVDVSAQPLGDVGARVEYPDSLGAEHVAATVVTEFVVDADGDVDPSTINVVASSGRAYADAVRAVLPDSRFTPATKDGAPVRQLVQLTIRFAPGGGVVARP